MIANTLRLSCWVVTIMMAVTATRAAPNIVFIIVDDMGWNDVSYHGSDQIQTPNIDALAYDGVILQQYYTEPICSPARAALLTGKYPMRLGMHGNPIENSEDRGIPTSERLLPAYLKDLGYATHLVGKWHVGMSRREYLPIARGYDTHYGIRGGHIDYYTYNRVETWPNGRKMFGLDFFDNDVPQEAEERYIIDALTDRAVSIINNHNISTPLFLQISHNAPHSGNEGAYLQPPLYSDVKNGHIADPDRRLYAGIVNRIDENVGQIIRTLTERQMLDDTIIIFASDNGAPSVGKYNNWGVNLPFRGIKKTPWEGAVRVPALMWHSSLRPRISNGLMHITDWLPTLIAAAGGQVTTCIDGVNQWDSIAREGEDMRNEVLITVFDSDTLTYAAYRAGDYKIILGNVTGLSNDYYGQQYMLNKGTPPNYYLSLGSSEVTHILKSKGGYFGEDKISAIRHATLITQDSAVPVSLCKPTATRGCLFNIRNDPTESHDLWDEDNFIATLLEIRLRSLWAMQVRRGPVNLSDRADPAYYNYTWTPWVV